MSRKRIHFPSICKCGCGKVTAPGKVWRSGHNTVESWTGRKHSEESKQKMSESAKKRERAPHSEETRKKIGKANKGKIRTEEHRKNISDAHIGKRIGSDHHFYGKKFSEEHKRKMSDSLRGKYIGELASNWHGGIKADFLTQLMNSYFYKDWRNGVLKQDNYVCQKCGSTKRLCVHHMVYLYWILDKFNINNMEDAINCKFLWNVNNGITYCKSCHIKFHSNFKKLQKKGINLCGISTI